MSDELNLWFPDAIKDLQKALEAAFASSEKLGAFTLTSFATSLGHIAGQGTIGNQVQRLIEDMHDTGRLRELVRKAIHAAPGNPSLLQFERTHLKVDFPFPIRASMAESVVGSIKRMQLSWPDVVDAAVKSLPSGAQLTGPENGTLADRVWELVDRVEGFPGGCGCKGVSALLEMAARLALKMGPNGALLQQWCMVRVAERKLQAVWPAVEQHVRKGQIAPFLLVSLVGSGDRFTMHVWLGSEEGKPPLLLAEPAENDAKPSIELAAELRKLLVHPKVLAVRRATRVGRLLIEFVLPFEELEMPVEQWMVQKGQDLEPLYLLHDVVIRPRERLYATVQADWDPEFAEAAVQWEQRWRTFVALDTGTFKNAVLWARDVSEYEASSFRKGLSKDSLVCLALAAVPADGRTPPLGAVKQGVYYGMPAVVWLRRGCGTGDGVRTTFEQIFAERDSIRREVGEARSRAYSQQCSWGNQLVILWDSLDHRPPDAIVDDFEAP